MPLEDIYIQEMDRATSRLEVVRVNPTRQFLWVELDAQGHWLGSPALIHWQNGAWYDTGGNPMDEKDVPPKFRKEIEDNPPSVHFDKQPAVTAVCKYCKAKMNQSEIEAHYIGHMDEVLKQAGTKIDVSAKTDANRHRG